MTKVGFLCHRSWGVRNWSFIALVGLFALAGCATRSKRAERVPDWESPTVVTQAVRLPTPQGAPSATNRTDQPPVSRAAGAGQRARDEFPETWIALERWCKATGHAAPTRLSTKSAIAYGLETSSGTFVLRASSQSAQWDGAELRMGFAPQWINGQLFVHRLDLQKTIQPLIGAEYPLTPDVSINLKARQNGLSPALSQEGERENSQESIDDWRLMERDNRSRTVGEFRPCIVIDPGHGGEDGGAKSILGNKLEKEFTLDWARRLGALLQSNGWQVFLTRTNDGEVSLSNRVVFAQEHKADLFVSLHFNSAGTNENEGGLETYCLTPSGMPSTVTRGYPDQPSLSFPNNEFDADNLRLAALVHKELLEVNGHQDRSVRRARFLGVLRGQQRPAILVEGGYLTNRREAALIARAEYRQKLAEAVAEGLQKRLKDKG